jgi:alpha/beta superfamily hydrolase
VLDVYGESDLPLVLETASKRRAVAAKQVMILKADHFYTGREEALTDAVTAFVAGLK